MVTKQKADYSRNKKKKKKGGKKKTGRRLENNHNPNPSTTRTPEHHAKHIDPSLVNTDGPNISRKVID